MKGSDQDAASPRPLASSGSVPRKILSQELFKGNREVMIEHGNRVYCLRVTISGKLILTA